MSLSGESEGEKEGGGKRREGWDPSHPNVFMSLIVDQVLDCIIVFLMCNVLIIEIGHEGGEWKVITVSQTLQTL